jgi:nucleotide-binding universal stress UspA family protein
MTAEAPNEAPSPPVPDAFEHLWLATDLSRQAEAPWTHAMGIAKEGPCDLHVLHAHEHTAPPDWTRLPLPRQNLIRWGLVKPDDGIEAFHRLGFRVHLHAARVDRPLQELRARVSGEGAPDLLVMGTHRPAFMERLLTGSFAEQVSRNSRGATLVVPDGAIPFIDPDTGETELRRILVPVGDAGAAAGFEAAARLVRTLGLDTVEFLFLHVGPYAEIPQIPLPWPETTEALGLKWAYQTLQHWEGSVVERTLEETVRRDIDLISMATRGHDSLADAIFGSRTERVLRDAGVPVLITRAS